MASLNKVILVGNLTREPELRYTPGGAAICTLGLAMNHRYKTASGEEREDVCFVDVEVFGRQAEACNQYLRKGQPALVEGRLKLDSWEDKQTGQKRSRHKVSAEVVQFLGSRPAGAQEPHGAPAAPPPQRTPPLPESEPPVPPPGDNDIPF